MNFVDLIIVITLIIYAIDGYKRGFLELILEFLGFALAIFLAFRFDWWAGEIIASKITIPQTFIKPVGFMCVWFLVQFGYSLVLHVGYKFIPSNLRQAGVNKIGGIIPSLAKGILLIAILLILIMTLPLSGGLKNDISASFAGSRIVKSSAVLEGSLQGLFGEAIGNMVTFMTVKPPSSKIIKPNERVVLGFKTTEVNIDPASEAKMLELVNSERKLKNLSQLRVDPKLQVVARAHAADMFEKGFFSHVNLDGDGPFDRVKDAGIVYTFAGENLALAPNVDLAHTGLMNSPGHRANIMEPKFNRAGFGVIDGGIYGHMFVQEFRN